MITIKQKKATNLKTKESLYVSFPYSLDNVSKIKSLPKRHYIPETHEWEVPVSEINNVIALFSDQEINISGKVNTKVAEKIENRVMFDKVDGSDYTFKTTPFQHQIEGFNYGLAHNKFLLGDEQGLGKTKQAIDIAVSRKSQFKHTLIVCGVNGLKWNWLNEIGIHSNEKGHIIGSFINAKGEMEVGSVKDRLKDLNLIADEKSIYSKYYFLITNIETLRDDAISKKLEEMCSNGTIGMVIIDEIHKCKNAQSQQGKAIHRLKSYYKMALTGTPLMNQPLDLYNVLKWLDVEHHSFYQFRNRYCVMGGYGGYEVVGYKNLAELKQELDSVMLRRLKCDVFDLPEKVHTTEYVEMAAKQTLLYKQVRDEIRADIDKIKVSPNPLAQLIRLRQATGWTGILSSSIAESAKMDRMVELVEDATAEGGKVIIFSNWEEITKIARAKLKAYNPAYITGTVKDRQHEVEKFQHDDKCKVIIGTIGAMGTGLTLTAGQTVIFLDEPWNKANKDQAEDRAHRIGTTGTVNIITIVCKDTIDERIREIVEEKGEMADMLVDGKLNKTDRSKLVDWLVG